MQETMDAGNQGRITVGLQALAHQGMHRPPSIIPSGLNAKGHRVVY